jgi:hypothetical protein
MKFNKWTVALAAIGVVNLTSAARADEKISQVQTALSNTTLSGYVDTAAIWQMGPNSNQSGGHLNLPAETATGGTLQDGFQLNVVDLVLDKPEDESPWASGYHVELQFGPDAVGQDNTYGGITQAFVRLRTPVGNGIDWQVGVWDTIVGYETLNDPANPNFTRSYAYEIEPTTHTGILGTYKINDEVTVQAGIADGSNVGTASPSGFNGRSNDESQKAYMGDVQLTAPSSWGWINGATLYAGFINADDSTVGGGSTSLYLGTTVPTPMTALKFGGSFDYVSFHNTGPGNSDQDSIWDIALYSTYQATAKLSLNFRAEYLDNAAVGASTPTPFTNVGTSNAEEFTATAQYALWANVLSRVEFRWDHAETTTPGNGFGAAGTNHNNFMLAANFVYQF